MLYSVLVEAQGEMLDQIEYSVQQAHQARPLSLSLSLLLSLSPSRSPTLSPSLTCSLSLVHLLSFSRARALPPALSLALSLVNSLSRALCLLRCTTMPRYSCSSSHAVRRQGRKAARAGQTVSEERAQGCLANNQIIWQY